MTDDLEVIERFLSAVWRLQPPAPVVFMSTKDWTEGTWTDHAMTVDNIKIPHGGDLYFSPHRFTGTRRTRRMSADRGRWLYADLDEVDPRKIDPEPTIAWETSPGRYQCMWLLDRPVPRRRLEQLNQRMTYYTGADKGGWSLTKVLRVPGSVSRKRDDPWMVRSVLHTHNRYDPTELTELLRDVDTTGTTKTSLGPVPALNELPTYADAMRRNRRKMTARAKQLIGVTVILQSDDRSARMWELMVSLARSDINPKAILAIVQATRWNKYTGQRREYQQLWREITKAIAHVNAEPAVPDPPKQNKGSLPNTLSYAEFMRKDWPRPTWLIENIWMAGMYGILAGEYKSFKTMLLLDMTLSVASGEPFLGKHRVVEPGMVCYVHEEGREGTIHERLTRIAHMKGLHDTGHRNGTSVDDFTIEFRERPLPIQITSLPKLNLTTEESRAALAQHVVTHKPKLLILETFYRLATGVSESNIEEIAPMLEYLAHLSHEFGCAVVLSHHFHKARDDGRSFDRVAGSNIFGRWYESAMFVERTGEEEDNTIRIQSSHRDGGYSKGKLKLVWDSDDDGESFAIHHLDMDEAGDRAVEHVIDLGNAMDIRDMSPADRQRAVDYITSLDEPTPLTVAKRELELDTTEQVQSIVRRIPGYTVKTNGGKRYIIPING